MRRFNQLSARIAPLAVLLLLSPCLAMAQRGGRAGSAGRGGFAQGHSGSFRGGFGFSGRVGGMPFRPGVSHRPFVGGTISAAHQRVLFPQRSVFFPHRNVFFRSIPKSGFYASVGVPFYGYGYPVYYGYPYPYAYGYPYYSYSGLPYYAYYPGYTADVAAVAPSYSYSYGGAAPAEQPSAADRFWLIALKDGSVALATDYWLDGNTLHYVTREGKHLTVDLSNIDLDLSRRLNRERGMDFQLPKPKAEYQPKQRDAYGGVVEQTVKPQVIVISGRR